MVALLGAAEMVLVFVDVATGAVLHGVVLATLVTLQARRASHVEGPALAALTLVPLLRLLSLTTPVPEWQPIWWLVLASVPLATAAIIAARALGLSRAALGLGRAHWPTQLGVALTGVPAGIGWWLWADPAPLGVGADTGELFVLVIVIALGIGVLEEFVFRGVIQAALSRAYSDGGVALTAALFGVMYLGTLSVATVVSISVIGLAYGIIARVTHSIVGVAISHSLVVVGGLVVWPRVLG